MSPTTPYVQSGEPLNDFLVDAAEQETPDYRHPPLPLARIKKVMKTDAPILFSKACETPSRADIAKALVKSDQLDFLIYIVTREEGLTGLIQSGTGTGAVAGGSGSSMTNLVAGPSQAASHQDPEHQVVLDQVRIVIHLVVLESILSLRILFSPTSENRARRLHFGSERSLHFRGMKTCQLVKLQREVRPQVLHTIGTQPAGNCLTCHGHSAYRQQSIQPR
ncbi:hypothetical protein F4604DRAFT_1731388 [Suillus subluteus]|nr:hypothetical protein F4604DRAFT_1731388 [Suillus subluteus]